MFVRNVLLAVGAIFVLAGIGLMIAWFGQERKPATVVETRVEVPQPQQAALVAARKIPRATKLGEEDFKDAAPGEVHPGSLHRGEEKEFLGKLSRRDIAEGEPLIPDDFKPCEKLFVEQGYRAVSIFVDPAQSVAGLVVTGDYVDVILTQIFDEKITKTQTTSYGGALSHTTTTSEENPVFPLERKAAGETVLRDVKVLATDQTLCVQSGVAATISTVNTTPKTVTLALKERQAELLMVAGKLGTFQLALVRHDESAGPARPEDEREAHQPVWASDVSLAIRELATAEPPPLPPQQMSVRVFSGMPASAGYLCSKSACVPSGVTTVTPQAQNLTQAIPGAY
jgi:pilus assembly protein CpaB